MMGDGVNDVLSLKRRVGRIAMQSAAAPPACPIWCCSTIRSKHCARIQRRPAHHFGHDQRAYLFLARSMTTTLLIVAVTMVGLNFPFDPSQVALTTFTVGIPAFFLTLWAKPRSLEPDILKSLVRFVLPVAILTMLMGVGLYLFDYNNAKSAPTAIAAGTAGGAVVTDTVQSGAIVTDSVQATSTLSTSAATTTTQTTTQTTTIPDALLASYSEYTGVSPDDPSFGDAFGTIAAQGA